MRPTNHNKPKRCGRKQNFLGCGKKVTAPTDWVTALRNLPASVLQLCKYTHCFHGSTEYFYPFFLIHRVEAQTRSCKGESCCKKENQQVLTPESPLWQWIFHDKSEAAAPVLWRSPGGTVTGLLWGIASHSLKIKTNRLRPCWGFQTCGFLFRVEGEKKRDPESVAGQSARCPPRPSSSPASPASAPLILC